MLEQPAFMTTDTLLSLIRRHSGEPHTVFGTVDGWHSDEVRKAADERAHTELTANGLAGAQEVHPGLLATVEALTHPYLEYYGWIAGGYEGRALNYTLLAGIGHQEAFVLARNTDTESVLLVSVHPNELLQDFIAQLPALPPGKGQPVAAATGDVLGRESDPDDYDTLDIMRSDRSRSGDHAATEVTRILSLQRLGGGQLYAAARSRAGVRKRIERPIVYIDTGEGRWLTEEIPGRGEPQFACTPATQKILAERLGKGRSTLQV